MLGTLLARYRDEHPIVLGLPRGGVVVAAEVARALDAPLDVLVVRKLGAPFQPELGIGALAEGDVLVVDERAIALGIEQHDIEEVREREARELERRVRRYRGERPPPDLTGRMVILVDDGIATGGTARAAIRAVRKLGARSVVLAVPVAPAGIEATFEPEADALVCCETPDEMWAIGLWYDDFRQVSDAEVAALLDGAKRAPAGQPHGARSRTRGRRYKVDEMTADPGTPVAIPTGADLLEGDLAIPEGAGGLVLFVHGSGSSRHSPRNRYVARVLRAARLGTLLFDLLTDEEETVDATGELRFDIPLLAGRLLDATRFARSHPASRHLPIGYFGASTGAAAALVAAAREPGEVLAIVSRGGRPDLADPILPRVGAPTLLLVGGADYPVIEMNRAAFERLRCEKELVVVPGATHLFEEPGALEEVAHLAAAWFASHLAEKSAPATL